MKKNRQKDDKDNYQDFFEKIEGSWSAERLERVKNKSDQILFDLQLREIREKMGIRQSDVKGFTQSNISRLESRTDMKLQTLIDYIQALGLGLEIKVIFKDKKPHQEALLLRA